MKRQAGRVLQELRQATGVTAEVARLAQELSRREHADGTKFEDFLALPASRCEVISSPELKHVVVIGIGGSSLGPKAVYDAVFGYFDKVQPKRFPKLHLLESVDTEYIDALVTEVLESANYHEVAFVVICKSGKTFETLKNLEYLTSARCKGAINSGNTYVVSVEGNHTWEWGKVLGAKLFPMSSVISGRFQVFSAMTTVSLGLAGVNTAKFFQGGIVREGYTAFQRSAGQRFQLYQNGIDTDIYFAFDERLKSLAEWYASITAESLGKNGGGITPIASVGSRDNHSMLQLYLQGSRNKFTSFISLSSTDQYNLKTLDAVKQAYEDANLPYCHIELDAESADTLTYELGEFMQAKMIETVLLGGLMGVNPYDQPGVELYKKYLQ